MLRERIKGMRDKRANKVSDLSAIVNNPEHDETKGFSVEDDGKIKALNAEIEELDTSIKTLQKSYQLTLKQQAAGAVPPVAKHQTDRGQYAGEAGNVKEIRDNFSILKAIRERFVEGGRVTGAESDAHGLASDEVRKSGRMLSGLGIPQAIIKAPTQAEVQFQGADTVPTDLSRKYIDMLQPRLLAEQLGGQVYRGMVGNLEIPKVTNRLTAAWEGEIDTAANTQLTTDKIPVNPHRMSAYTDISNQWMMQDVVLGDKYIYNALGMSHKRLLDSSFWNGAGAGVTDPITGVLNLAGSYTGSLGAAGGNVDRDKLIDLVGNIENNDADIGEMSFVTTPLVKAWLMKQRTDAGSGQFVWSEGGSDLLGYKTFTTTILPQNLQMGLGTNLHPIVFGVFKDASIYQWGGYDLTVDPYTQQLNATLRIVAHSWYDIAFAHEQAFAMYKDVAVV